MSEGEKLIEVWRKNLASVTSPELRKRLSAVISESVRKEKNRKQENTRD